MSPVEITAILGALATLVGTLIAFKKIKPERDSMVITSAQGATTILNDLVKTLYTEIDRLRVREGVLELALKEAEDRVQAAEAEAEGLRQRYGSRRSDPDG